MKINAIKLDRQDNVVTCVCDIASGENVVYKAQEQIINMLANEAIPAWHKIAIADIPKGQSVIKYGEIIGKAQQTLEKGCWVYHLNIVSVPRSYDDELV